MSDDIAALQTWLGGQYPSHNVELHGTLQECHLVADLFRFEGALSKMVADRDRLLGIVQALTDDAIDNNGRCCMCVGRWGEHEEACAVRAAVDYMEEQNQ